MCPYDIKTPKLKLFLKTTQQQSIYGMISTFFSIGAMSKPRIIQKILKG